MLDKLVLRIKFGLKLYSSASCRWAVTSLSFFPTRAIYFAAYSGVKERLNTVLVPESKKVHMLSAACAGELFLSQIRARESCLWVWTGFNLHCCCLLNLCSPTSGAATKQSVFSFFILLRLVSSVRRSSLSFFCCYQEKSSIHLCVGRRQLVVCTRNHVSWVLKQNISNKFFNSYKFIVSCLL